MVVELKKRGQLSWSSGRCTPIVREMIAQAKQLAEVHSFDGTPEESVQF